MDMTYAFLAHLYGDDDKIMTAVMNGMEYAPHTDPHWDPFSIVHKVILLVPLEQYKAKIYQVPGADVAGSVADCVRPVGY
jgi:hypothetical protein